MKEFFSTFEKQVPGIIDHLNAINANSEAIKAGVFRLLDMEKEKLKHENSKTQIEELTWKAVDDLEISLWAKDLKGKFIFANKKCCQTILKSTFLRVSQMTDDEFKQDALACVCMESDQKVIESQETKRFIECAQYHYEQIFLLVTKSPTFDEEGKVSGTIGSAHNITDNVPDTIKDQYDESASVEIPLKLVFDNWMIIDLLDKRKRRITMENEDEKCA